MIQFSQPWALLALLSIPLIIVLYSLRPRRNRISVPGLALWREALRERQRGFGIRKLLRDLSLLILLLLALALSLALADPSISRATAERLDVVVVLDVSASMKARLHGSVLGRTRFDEAKRQASDIIDGLDDDARMLIMTSGRFAVLRTAFESNRDRLRSTLADLRATDEAGQPRAALALALSLLRNVDAGRVYFLTDAAFDEPLDFGAAQIEFRLIGGPVPNVAITQFDFRSEIGSDVRSQVLLSVRNYTRETVDTEVSVRLDESELLRRGLTLPPLEKRTLVLPLTGDVTGVARADIDHLDALPADNRAYAVVEGAAPLEVLLFGDGNFYLESALQALPNVRVNRQPAYREDVFAYHSSRGDVIIFDRLPAPALPEGSFMLIDTVAPQLPFYADGYVSFPRVAARADSPLLGESDLSGVRIDRARRLVRRADAGGVQPLFWSDQTDLALTVLDGNRRVVFLGFDLADSTFALQAAFPMFLAESLAWLQPGGGTDETTQLRAGESVTIIADSAPAQITVRAPGGEAFNVESDSRRLQFEQTSDAGIYRYSTASAEHRFAVNLTDERESDVRPRAVLPAPASSSEAATGGGRVELPLWPYLVLAAMLLLWLEWGLWCWRRSGA